MLLISHKMLSKYSRRMLKVNPCYKYKYIAGQLFKDEGYDIMSK
jgi:hypothetical protein